MGEYHTVREPDGTIKSIYKLSACDDWRYVRRSEAEQLAPRDAGQGTNIPAAIAEPQPGDSRGPWEDNDAEEKIVGRDMETRITVSVLPELVSKIKHDRVSCSVSAHRKGSYNLNVFIPCPNAPEFSDAGLKTSLRYSYPISICGERYAGSVARSIFQCGYCEALFSLPEDELEKVR